MIPASARRSDRTVVPGPSDNYNAASRSATSTVTSNYIIPHNNALALLNGDSFALSVTATKTGSESHPQSYLPVWFGNSMASTTEKGMGLSLGRSLSKSAMEVRMGDGSSAPVVHTFTIDPPLTVGTKFEYTLACDKRRQSRVCTLSVDGVTATPRFQSFEVAGDIYGGLF